MPHFIAECTDNIREQADLPGLFAKVNEALAATGIFLSAVSAAAPLAGHGRWPTASTITPLSI